MVVENFYAHFDFLLSDWYRVNLEELAQILKEHGAINAINLDGGGSATFVVNDTVINYPSDTWYI